MRRYVYASLVPRLLSSLHVQFCWLVYYGTDNSERSLWYQCLKLALTSYKHITFIVWSAVFVTFVSNIEALLSMAREVIFKVHRHTTDVVNVAM